MRKLSRRECMAMAVKLGFAFPAASYFLNGYARAGTLNGALPISLEVSARWGQHRGQVAAAMTGLSYESAQLGDPDFFSPDNQGLIALFKQLSGCGILRLGGNLSEYTRWSPQSSASAAGTHAGAVAPDTGKNHTHPEVLISPKAIHNLSEFLKRTGWKAIYGLNLARANPERVAAEAKYVFHALGENLIAFQIGNEPNHYVMNGLRPAGYTFADYFREWSHLHAVVQAAVPRASFGGPDVAEGAEWIEQFAKVAPKSVILLTGHHYAEGPPASPSANIENLLAPDPLFTRQMEKISSVAKESGLPFIMAETNSCYNGGKQGLSNVFASALWATDYILQLAQMSVKGVCFHGGANAWYTPIAGGGNEPYTARPIFFALEFCRSLLGEPMSPVSITTSHKTNIAVYAFHRPRKVVVVNKDSLPVSVDVPVGERVRQIERLVATELTALDDVRIEIEKVDSRSGHKIIVQPYSAAILSLQSI